MGTLCSSYYEENDSFLDNFVEELIHGDQQQQQQQ